MDKYLQNLEVTFNIKDLTRRILRYFCWRSFNLTKDGKQFLESFKEYLSRKEIFIAAVSDKEKDHAEIIKKSSSLRSL